MSLNRMGWQCPRCSTCYSPDVTQCRHCVTKIYQPNTLPLPNTTPAVVPNKLPWEINPTFPPYSFGKAVANTSAIMFNGACGGANVFLIEDK